MTIATDELTGAAAAEAERPITYCERCNLESRHFIKQTEPDGATRDVCWKCVSRGEKRFNLKETWKRGGRARLPHA